MVEVKKIENIIGYEFKNNDLLVEALESRGHSRVVSHKQDGNPRLALLGDAVLGLAQLDQWYPTKESTGTGDYLLKAHVTNVRLQECAEQLGITDEILLNPAQASQSRVPKRTSASTMEALLGAVWVDSGKDLEQVQKVACKMGILEEK